MSPAKGDVNHGDRWVLQCWLLGSVEQAGLLHVRPVSGVLAGGFMNIYNNASAYRGELLGMVRVHLLSTFVMEFFSLDQGEGNALCDNKGALGQASRVCQCIHTGSKHSDLLRSLRSMKMTHSLQFCTHMCGHIRIASSLGGL